MLFLLFELAMAGNSPEAQEPEESGPEQPSNSDEHCPLLAAMVRAQVLDGPPTITDDQWVASLEHIRGPPPPPPPTQQAQSSSSSSATPASTFWSTSQKPEFGNTTNTETQKEVSTPARTNRERSHTPPGAPLSKSRKSLAMTSISSPQDQLYAALRSQRTTLSPEELQSALDVAFALRSTLEAEGHTHEEIVDGAEQVTNALIAQWVAEDLHPARIQEEEVAVENKEEEECEVDEEISTIASDAQASNVRGVAPTAFEPSASL